MPVKHFGSDILRDKMASKGLFKKGRVGIIKGMNLLREIRADLVLVDQIIGSYPQGIQKLDHIVDRQYILLPGEEPYDHSPSFR